MPNKSTLNKMTKPELVDFGCGYFDDTGNLRQELEDMKKDDLLTILIDNGATEEEDTVPVVVETKRTTPSVLDLGSG